MALINKWIRASARYGFAIVTVALLSVIRWWLIQSFGPMPLFITWYPVVILTAVIAGGGPGILATILSVLVADYWFIEPIGQFGNFSLNDAVSVGIFSGTCIFISILTERLKRARLAEAVSLTQKKELALLNTGNLMTLDLDHRIKTWSEGNRRLYGFDSQEISGKLTYEILRTKFDQPMEDIRKELVLRGHWEGEVTRVTKKGDSVTVALLWALRRDEDGNPLAILEVSTDLTQQKAAEEALKQQSEELAQQNEELHAQSEELAQQSEELSEQNEELQAQSEEVLTLNAELTHRERMLQTLLDAAHLPIGEHEVMGKICQAALEMIGKTAIGAVVCEAHDNELQILAHAGFDGHAVPASWPLRGSFIEMVVREDRTAALEDSFLRPDFKLLEVSGCQRFSAIISSPLHIKGSRIGAVSVYSDKPRQWTADQFRMIEWLAAKCSNALESIRLAEEVQQSRKHNEFLAGVIQRSSQAFGVGYADGRLGLINKAFEELTGYTGDELRSMDWAKTLTPPEWFEFEHKKLEELDRTGLPVRYEKEYIRKDGTRAPIELLVHLIKDEEGQPLCYYSFINDISERKRNEEALRLSEEKFALAFAGNPAAIVLSRLEDGLLLDVNNTWEELMGYRRTEVIGFPARNLHIWPTTDEASKFIRELRQNGTLRGWEQDFLKRSGEVFTAQLSATIIMIRGEKFILSSMVDITEKKRAEQALLKSEEKYRNLFMNMTEEVHFWKLVRDEAGEIQTWKLVDANPPTVKSWGRESVDEIRGMTADEIFGPGAMEHYMPVVQKIFAEGVPHSFVDYFPNLDKHFRFTSVPFGDFFITTGADITTVTKAHELVVARDEELKRLNRTLRALSNTGKTTIHAANEADLLAEACRIIVEDCGYPMTWIGFAEEDHDKTIKPVAQAGFEQDYLKTVKITWSDTELGRGPTGTSIRTGEPSVCKNILTDPRMLPWRKYAVERGYASSIALPLKDGEQTFGALTIYSREPESFSDEEIKLLTELADDLSYGVTYHRLREAHNQSEMELKESRTRLDLALRASNMGVWHWDIVENKRYFDDRACRLLGIDPKNFTGAAEEFFQAVYADDQETIKKALAGTLANNSPYELEYRVVWPDESIHYISTRGMLNHNEEGEPVRLNGLIWDITTRKEMDKELRRSRDELELRVMERTRELSSTVTMLEQANAELQEFTHVTSHDLQEPLRKIQTFCDMIKTRSASNLDKAGQEYFNRVMNSVRRMRQLLNDLLQLSRTIGKTEPFKAIDLSRIAHEAADLFEEELKKTGGKVEIEAMPIIDADETQMLRLFQNLISNAVKYRNEKSPLINIFGRLEEKTCEIYVKDNGIGFKQEFAERIFKPFQRLHGKLEYEGTGMGLAICRKIVERHGGSIRAESAPEKGATFIISMPVRQKGGWRYNG
jgi:PAS domain S-box-containing protein